MIEVQLLALENLATILASVVVALEDIVARKLYFLLRQAIEEQEDNHARDADLPRNRRDHLVLGRGKRNIEPACEIMRREIVFVVGRDNLGMPLVKKGKSTTRRADIDRLPKAIEHQNLTVKCRVQKFLRGLTTPPRIGAILSFCIFVVNVTTT
jgi:hypothetical protein